MATRHGSPVDAARGLQSPGDVRALSDADLLAALWQRGYGGRSARVFAHDLLAQFGGLAGLLNAEPARILACPGLGPGRYAAVQAALELGRRHALRQLEDTQIMSSPSLTRRFLLHHLGNQAREIFCCLFLDNQHRVLRCEDLFMGTLDGAAVYPREVAVRALQYRAAAVILAHNHPSGVPEPSGADRRITERLVAALALLDIRVLDHIIVGCGETLSFAEEGLL
jgi:DNA repair protein RadC